MKLTKKEFEDQLQNLIRIASASLIHPFDIVSILELQKLSLYAAHIEASKHTPGWAALQQQIKETKEGKR